MKEAVDRLGAIIGLIVTSPIFLVVIIILKIQREDVFFLQERVGLNQKSFRMYKFTTMVKGSERQGTISTSSDRRITFLGKFLRKTNLNEVPQLINVLKGEMSFVGPRPLPKSEVERHYSNRDRTKIYSVKPGITGLGSLEFSDEDERLDKVNDVERYFAEVIMPRKAELETWYVDNWSIFLDVKLFFKTIFKLFSSFLRKLIPGRKR